MEISAWSQLHVTAATEERDDACGKVYSFPCDTKLYIWNLSPGSLELLIVMRKATREVTFLEKIHNRRLWGYILDGLSAFFFLKSYFFGIFALVRVEVREFPLMVGLSSLTDIQTYGFISSWSSLDQDSQQQCFFLSNKAESYHCLHT